MVRPLPEDALMVARKGKWEPYEPGLMLGTTEVLGVEVAGGTQKSTLYRVRYTCCGREDVVSHVSIVKRVANDSKQCSECSSTRRGRSRKTKAATGKVAEWRLYRDSDIPGVRCASGFWPSLGPLGFRSSDGDLDTSRVKRGSYRTYKDVT